MEEAVSNQHSDDLLWDVYGEAVARQVNLVCREVVQEEFESLRQEQLGQVRARLAFAWLAGTHWEFSVREWTVCPTGVSFSLCYVCLSSA